MLLTTFMPQENILPPTTKSPAIPAPPATTNAPVLVDTEGVKLLIKNVFVVPVDVRPVLVINGLPPGVCPSDRRNSPVNLS